MAGPVPAREAARILGVSARHVARLAGRGELAFKETPLGRLYDRASLERRRALPPRRGRPPTRRPTPEPAGPEQEGTFIVMEEKVTLVDERGQPTSVLAGGRPHRVSAELARRLIERGGARRLG